MAKLVMSSPKYEEKYEVEDVANNEDSDDEYVAKDKRSKSEVLKDCEIKFVNCAEAQKLAKLIVKELTVVAVLMRMCDSDKLRAGKVWIHSHQAHAETITNAPETPSKAHLFQGRLENGSLPKLPFHHQKFPFSNEFPHLRIDKLWSAPL